MFVGTYYQDEEPVKLRTFLQFNLDQFNDKTITNAELVLREETVREEAINSRDTSPVIEIYKIFNWQAPTWYGQPSLGSPIGTLHRTNSNTYSGDITTALRNLRGGLLLKVRDEGSWNLKQFSLDDSYVRVTYTDEGITQCEQQGWNCRCNCNDDEIGGLNIVIPKL